MKLYIENGKMAKKKINIQMKNNFLIILIKMKKNIQNILNGILIN